MTSGPHVVVGVPTHNNVGTIDDTLDMLDRQTRPPDDILICDNSSDGTDQVVRRYSEDSDLPITLLGQSGDGVAAAYNQMLHHMGRDIDIFATIHTNIGVPDDWLEGHIAIHRNRPEIGMVTAFDGGPDGEIEREETYYYSGRNISFKRDTLKTVNGWDDNFLRGEDWDMHIRLGCSGVRSYSSSSLDCGWGSAKDQLDPYVSIAKVLRRPTSVTFLWKFGWWYVGFHPTHVAHDALGLASIVLLLAAVVLAGIDVFAATIAVLTLCVVIGVYVLGHLHFQGPVDGSRVVQPIKKQLLTGLGVLVALRRLTNRGPWNRTGFDPDADFVYDRSVWETIDRWNPLRTK